MLVLPVLGRAGGQRVPPAGSTVYTCMLNKRGGVESDLTVSRISPGDPSSPLAPAFQGKTLGMGQWGLCLQPEPGMQLYPQDAPSGGDGKTQ